MTSNAAWIRAVAEFHCERCGAAPGEPCRRYWGELATKPHVHRLRQENAAWEKEQGLRS